MSAVTSRAALRMSPLQSCTLGAIGLALLTTAAGCGSTEASKAAGGSSKDDAGIVIPVSKADSGSHADTGSGHTGKTDTEAGTIIHASMPEAGQADGGHDAVADVDHGAPSTTYPAFAVDVAQVTDNGGSVLSAPVIVTVTWSTDPDATTWNAFDDGIGPSAYWHTLNSEYGVGPSTSAAANHVSITTAPPTGFSDMDLDALVSAHAGVDWPASTPNTIYAVYMPPGAALYLGGSPDAGGQDACQQGVGGYHDETQDSNHYVYAIMPHCSMFQAADIELSASHELNEAATDPHPETNLAYQGFDQSHLAFEFFNEFQDEIGDACESFVEATDSTDYTPYTVQRQWSNKSAAAGSHWCVPALNEPFYNTTFLPQSPRDNISVNIAPLGLGLSSASSQGFKLPLNTSRTFAIGYFSDVATSGPFTLDIQGLDQPIGQDESGNVINNGAATVTIDRTSGVNGDIAYVTATPTAYSTLGVVFFYIRAVLPGAQQHHYVPVLLSQN